MPGGVYLLCAATSLACAVLLMRGYRAEGVRLLFWSSLCFFGLAIDNVLLYVDIIIVPDVELLLWRKFAGLLSLMLLLYGLIWDAN